jgi:hypothetical protein
MRILSYYFYCFFISFSVSYAFQLLIDKNAELSERGGALLFLTFVAVSLFLGFRTKKDARVDNET